MKKYLLKESGEELEFGDIIGITLKKVTEDGCVTVEKELEFTPDEVEFLLDMDIIEETEALIDFEDEENEEEGCPFEGRLEALEERVEELEEQLDKLLKGKNASQKKK